MRRSLIFGICALIGLGSLTVLAGSSVVVRGLLESVGMLELTTVSMTSTTVDEKVDREKLSEIVNGAQLSRKSVPESNVQERSGSEAIMSEEILWSIVFDFKKKLEEKGAEADAKGERGTLYSNYFVRQGPLSAENDQILKQKSEQYFLEVDPLVKNARTIHDNYEKTKDGSLLNQVKGLQKQRDEISIRLRDEMKTAFGGEAFDGFVSFLKTEFTDGMKSFQRSSPQGFGSVPYPIGLTRILWDETAHPTLISGFTYLYLDLFFSDFQSWNPYIESYLVNYSTGLTYESGWSEGYQDWIPAEVNHSIFISNVGQTYCTVADNWAVLYDGYMPVYDYYYGRAYDCHTVNAPPPTPTPTPASTPTPTPTPDPCDLISLEGCEPAGPRVRFLSQIGSVEKGSVKTIMARVEDAPVGHVTRFRFKNKPNPTIPCPLTGCITGEARFENGTPEGTDEISFQGNGDFPIPIRGWQRSSSNNNVDLQARFNNDSSVKEDQSFSVSSVEFVEETECNGFDNVEFKRTGDFTTYLSVPRGGSNRVKAKVVPSGATGNFKFEVLGGNGIGVSPATINTTSEQVVTVSATATADRNHTGIYVKANNNDPLTTAAELLFPHALKRKEMEVKIFKVKEDNDDVQAIPVGQGAPNKTAFVILNGPNGVLNTSPQGDDVLSITPYWERPPSQIRNPRLFRIMTGTNGILESSVQGDDQQYVPTSSEEQALYAPVTEIGNGTPNAVCVTRGANNFLDTFDLDGDDQEIADPSNTALKVISAGTNGRCQTNANQTDLLASNPPSLTVIQDYLNARWGAQANVFFTVNATVQEIDVNYDLDRDRRVQVPNFQTDTDEINAMTQPISGNTINMYWAGVDFSDVTILGIGGITGQPNPGSHSWFASNTLANQTRALHTIAHEIGHALGRKEHTSQDLLELHYQRDLMYFKFLEGAPFNQCRVRQPDWNLVNGDL